MTTVKDLTFWNQACEHIEKGRYDEALKDLTSMRIQTSKTRFNITLAYSGMGQTEKALQMLSETLHLDAHFAIGFFYRGNIYYKEKRFLEALQDFKDGHKLMGRSYIDYTQLGMRFKLESISFQYNMSLCKAALGMACPPLEIRLDLHTGNIIGVPQGLTFRPPKAKVANMHKIDYLGQAKVVTALTEEDNFSGFSGARKLEVAKNMVKSTSDPSFPSPAQWDTGGNSPKSRQNEAASSSTFPPTNNRGKLAVPPQDARSKTPPARWKDSTEAKRILPPPPNRPIPMPPQAGGKLTHMQQMLMDSQNQTVLFNPSVQPRRQLPIPTTKAENMEVDHKPLRPSPNRTELKNKPLPPRTNGVEHRLGLPNTDESATVRRAPSPNFNRPILDARHLGLSLTESSSSPPPPLPPKNPLPPKQMEFRGNKRKISPKRDSPQREKPLPAEPGSSTTEPVCDRVKVELICNHSHTVELPNQSSLATTTQQAASVFKLDHGTFNIWCRQDGDYEMIGNQADMLKWWKVVSMKTDKQLWIFGK